MEASDRKTAVNLGLIVIACGAVVTLLASGISKDPMVLTFGIGPMLLGFVVVLTGFFGSKKRSKPLPAWKTLIMPVAILAIVLPRLLFDYRFPHWTRPYLLSTVAILCVVALWPIHPAERGEDHS
ncbi:MAG TPA: hypothetical protein VIY69_06000 [Candidatus Acidoferrales bacterium]